MASTMLLACVACNTGSGSASPTPAAPTVVATAIANVQATGQPIATRVAGSMLQLPPADVGRLIGTTIGASIDITTTPSNVSNDQVTQATLNGTDRSGAWGRLDQQARRAFAGAGLQLARQAFPKATVDLTVVDTSGNKLLSATYPPDGQPNYQ